MFKLKTKAILSSILLDFTFFIFFTIFNFNFFNFFFHRFFVILNLMLQFLNFYSFNFYSFNDLIFSRTSSACVATLPSTSVKTYSIFPSGEIMYVCLLLNFPIKPKSSRDPYFPLMTPPYKNKINKKGLFFSVSIFDTIM